MNDAQFWKILDQARSESGADTDAIGEAVYEVLLALPASEIESFQAVLRSKVAAAYTWKLWGAAYLMNGGCSDDGFEYFRGWLIAQGQKVYEAAVADPDSLAPIADPDDDYHECEEILYVPGRAYEEVAGKAIPAPPASTRPPEPAGERWDFDDMEATAQQLPRMARKYDAG